MTNEEQRELLKRITFNPEIFGGKPIIRGMRMSVRMILSLLAQGVSREELLREYPLESEDIDAALLYAAVTVGDESIDEIQMVQ